MARVKSYDNITNPDDSIEFLVDGAEVQNITYGDLSSALASENETLQNKTVDTSNSVTLLDSNFKIQSGGNGLTFNVSGLTQDRALTLPDADGTLVLEGASQTLQNKTISGANNTITIRVQDLDFDPATQAELDSHANATNPHGISLSDLGPVSISDLDFDPATQTELNSHTSDTANPHSTTKSDLGLGNVENVDQTNASNLTSGSVPDARITQSSVTQHEDALTIDEGQIGSGTALGRLAEENTWTADQHFLNLTTKSEPVNVKHSDYGAVGDGTTDDRSAIVSAMGSNAIYVPQGTYRLTGSNVSLSSNIYLFGHGRQSVISLEDLTITANGNVNVFFKNLKIKAESGTSALLSLSNACSNVVFRNVVFDCAGNAPTAIDLTGNSNKALTDVYVTDCHIINPTSQGMLASGVDNVNVRGTIIDGYAGGNNAYGIWVKNNNSNGRVSVRDSSFEKSDNHSIRIQDAEDIRVAENYFESRDQGVVNNGSDDQISLENVTRGSVTENVIRFSGARGIYLESSDNITLNGNKVYRSDGPAIYLNSSDECSITGNTLTECYQNRESNAGTFQSPIALTGTSSRNHIQANTSRDLQATKTQIYFIELDTNVSGTVVINNDARGSYSSSFMSDLAAQTITDPVAQNKSKNSNIVNIGAISNFSVTNPSSQDIQISFDSTVKLVDILVSISGAESATLTESDFTETGSYTYTATYSGSTDGTYTATLDSAEDSSGNDSANNQSDNVVVDTAAPTLTNPTASSTGTSTADGSADTDEGKGTFYFVVTQSSTKPSSSQVIAGQDHNGSVADDSGSVNVTSTGTQNVSASGLTSSTQYYFHFTHDDEEGNISSVVSATFTTGGSVSESYFFIQPGQQFVT